MKKSNIQEQIGSNYLIKEFIGSGFSAYVFLVLDKETNEECVAKVFKKGKKDACEEELKVVNILKEENNPYILRIKTSGEGDLIRKNRPKMKTKYYISEYASFGNIFDYIYYGKIGLGELYSKIIFSKIMEGIKVCHEHNICHRDLKLENILLDSGFCPKICDFGFACINASDLNDNLGTSVYKPPEIRLNIPYDGKKGDIFCLGVALMMLVTGKLGFEKAEKSNPLYRIICKNQSDLYFKILESLLKDKGIKFSKEFKDLYMKMVAFDPNSRLTAEQVLNHAWFNEINELKKDKVKMEKIENEIKKIFRDLEKFVKKNVKIYLEDENKKSEIENNYNSRSSENDDEIFFNNNIRAKTIDTYMNMNNCIRIKNLLNPNKFMNSLCLKIIKKFGKDNCFIEPNSQKLKFEVTFEEEKEKLPDEIEEELKKLGIEEEINTDLEDNELKMQIKIYNYSDDYILRFVQKEGDRANFLKKFEAISKLVENIIN